MLAKDRAKIAEDFIDDLNNEGDNTPCDVGCPEDIKMELPEWYDEDKFKRGQQFCRINLYSLMMSQYYGLLSAAGVCYKLLQVLDFTRNSSTPCKAYQRLSKTFLHTMSWFDDDFTINSEVWNSLLGIRRRHLVYSSMTLKHGIGFFSQKDMMETQLSLIGYIIAQPKYLGIHDPDKEDLEAFIHFWRTIGYMFGIKDRFNLCRESFEDTEAICVTYLTYMRNNYSLDYHLAVKMTNKAIDSLKVLNILINGDVLIFYTKVVLGLKGYECLPLHSNFMARLTKSSQGHRCQSDVCEFNKLNLSLKLKVLVKLWIMTHLFKNKVIKQIFVFGVRVTAFFAKYFPMVAILKFGSKPFMVNKTIGK